MNPRLRFAITAVIISLVILGLGFLALNQIIDYKYKAELIKSPCTLCTEYNQKEIDYFNLGNNITNLSIT